MHPRLKIDGEFWEQLFSISKDCCGCRSLMLTIISSGFGCQGIMVQAVWSGQRDRQPLPCLRVCFKISLWLIPQAEQLTCISMTQFLSSLIITLAFRPFYQLPLSMHMPIQIAEGGVA